MRRSVLLGLVAWCIAIVATLGSGLAVGAEADKPTFFALSPVRPAMTTEAMQAFLAQPLVARLATVRANGTPQISPMWFLYEDGLLYMSTPTQAAKVKHLRANPHVAVAIDVMEAPLQNKAAILEGTVEIQTERAQERTEQLYYKYMGKEGAATPAAQKSINIPRVILKITPQKIYSMDSTR